MMHIYNSLQLPYNPNYSKNYMCNETFLCTSDLINSLVYFDLLLCNKFSYADLLQIK